MNKMKWNIIWNTDNTVVFWVIGDDYLKKKTQV